MNCGRSSSVEWKLPKLQRRVRFPSPAPPPPGRAPGGFVMPVRGGIALHEGPTLRRHAVRRLRVVQTPPPLRAWRAHATDETGRNVGWREKTRPARPFQRLFREKTRPTRPKRPKLRRFKPAGRTFSRVRADTAPQGELFRARPGNFSNSKCSRTRRHIRAVHMKPPAPLLASCSELLKPTTPPRACPS